MVGLYSLCFTIKRRCTNIIHGLDLHNNMIMGKKGPQMEKYVYGFELATCLRTKSIATRSSYMGVERENDFFQGATEE